MLQAAERIADGQLPYRDFYCQLRARAVLPARRPRRAVRALAARLARSCAWRSTPAWPCSPTRWPGATPPSRWRSAPGWPSPPRWRSRASRTPTRPPWRSASARCCWPGGARRWPAALAGAGDRVPPRPGPRRRWPGPRWPARGRRAGGPRRRRRASRWRSCCWPRSCSPRPATSGTRRSASPSTSRASSACHCPARWEGGFEPNKILAALLRPTCCWPARALWLAVGRPRPAPPRASGPLLRSPPPGVGLPARARRRASTWSRWRPCCRCCWPPPLRASGVPAARPRPSRWRSCSA